MFLQRGRWCWPGFGRGAISRWNGPRASNINWFRGSAARNLSGFSALARSFAARSADRLHSLPGRLANTFHGGTFASHGSALALDRGGLDDRRNAIDHRIPWPAWWMDSRVENDISAWIPLAWASLANAVGESGHPGALPQDYGNHHDLLNLLGIAALQRGNVIEIAGQLVGVDAACSGIQSLQASLMASFFLWGNFKLSLRPGLALLFAGMFLSSALNLGRVIVLTYCAHQFGAQNQTLHDWIGGIATLLILGGIFFVAIRLRSFCKAAATESERTVQSVNEASINLSLDSSLSLARQAIVFAAFLMIPFLASLVLRSDYEGELAIRPRWQVNVDNLPAGWNVRAFSSTPSQAEMLRYTDWAAFHVHTSTVFGPTSSICSGGPGKACRAWRFITLRRFACLQLDGR